MRTPKEQKQAAWSALSGNWSKAVVATIVFYLIASVCLGPYVGKSIADPINPDLSKLGLFSTLLVFFIFYPLECGYYNSFRALFEKGDNALTSNMFKLGFKPWIKIVGLCFLMQVIIAVGYLLLIIPGIILTFAYAMAPFIIVDHPDLSISECLRRSRLMMRGHKFDYFYLLLTFILWLLLSIVTCGIALLWVLPYMTTTAAVFYNDLKAENGEAIYNSPSGSDTESVLES